jgi:hypothetical protein
VGAFHSSGGRRELAQPFVLDRADLLAHDAQPRQMAAQLRARVLQQRRPFRCAQTVEFFRCFAQGRPESANAKAGKDGLDLASELEEPVAGKPETVFRRPDRGWQARNRVPDERPLYIATSPRQKPIVKL